MKLSIPDRVLEQAVKCDYDHACAKTGQCGDREMCKVSDVDGTDILFLKDKKHAECSYRISFGKGQICRCPVHYWLQTNKQI